MVKSRVQAPSVPRTRVVSALAQNVWKNEKKMSGNKEKPWVIRAKEEKRTGISLRQGQAVQTS